MTAVISGADVVVCCGSGGVGKTTVAAAIGLAAAAGRSACGRRHDRPGPPIRGRARAARRSQGRPATDRARRRVGRVVGDDARHAGHVRARRAHERRERGAGGADRAEPLLPQHRRRPQRHPGVHGVRGALRAARRSAVRPGRGRHATQPERARFPRGARRARPLPRPQGVQA